MNFKLNTLVAAVAVVAAGAAQAQLSSPGNGTTAANAANGSLTFVFVDNIGSPISFEANLKYNLLDFLPSSTITKNNQLGATGTIVWDFKNDTLTAGGSAVAGTYNWSSVFNPIGTGAQAAELKWGVYAADNNSNGAQGDGPNNRNRRNLAVTLAAGTDTSAVTTAKLTSATGIINTYTNILNVETAPNTIGTGIGAASASSGNAYLLGGSSSPGTTLNGGIVFEYLFANNTSANFALLTGVASNTGASVNTAYDGVFNFDYAAGTLTYTVAAVPEPSTYAMLLAGLVAVGFLARRRSV
jgi:hypothetical protein